MISKVKSMYINDNISYIIAYNNDEIEVILKIYNKIYKNVFQSDIGICAWIQLMVYNQTKILYQI